MVNEDAIIQQFTTMTGASAESAQSFLEMANWDLKAAVNQFYESGEQSRAMAQGQKLNASQQSAAKDASFSSPGTFASGSSNRVTPKKPASKIRTLGDLSNHGQDSDGDNDQNLFVGGEKSGMVVQGPSKDNDIVSQILKKAAQNAPSREEKGARRQNCFSGTGHKLGSDEVPSEAVGQPQPTQDEETLEPVTRYLTFWRNGFSVDDGPLYRYDDPVNQNMLTAINSGRAPLSLLNVRHGQPVDVRVTRRQGEDYVPPKTSPKPFEGAGRRLGSPAAYVPSSPSTTPATAQVPGAFPATSTNTPIVDNRQPVTQLQIRLANGSRLVAKFNHTHTINDIRRYIQAIQPTDREYILQTSFPVRELMDESQTLKEAQLLNAVVLQRYK